MNTERLLKLADFIEALPAERVDMNGWVLERRDDADEFGEGAYWEEVSCDTNQETIALLGSSCDTAGCIAGWACHMHPSEISISHFNLGVSASRILGLDFDERDNLFYHAAWPRDLKQAYGSPLKDRNTVVATAIRRFVSCGGDWSNEPNQ
jgi:hypothetical protein